MMADKFNISVPFLRLLTKALILLAFCAILPHSAKAQNNKVLTLNTANTVYNLVPWMGVTRDPGRSLDFNVIYKRYLNGQRGTHQKGAILTLGDRAMPYWLVFEVHNLSNTDRWLLTFGDHMAGKSGLAQNILLYDQSTQTRLLDNVTAEARANHSQSDMSSSTRLNIKRGTKALLFLYIVPRPGFPVALAPRLMTEDAYQASLRSPFNPTMAMVLLMAGIFGMFVGLMLFRSYPGSLLFIGYLTAQIVFLFYLNDIIYTSAPLAYGLSGLFFAMTAVMALALARHFLDIAYDQPLQDRILLLCGGIVIAAAVVGSFILKDRVQTLALYGPGLLAYLFLFALSVAQSYIGKPAALRFGLVWLLGFVGALASYFTLSGHLPPETWLACAYWYLLIPQAFLLFSAAKLRLYILADEQENSAQQDAQSKKKIEALQQNKEASENQRLLRLIEHERGAMNELREREVQQKEEMRKAKETADEANRDKSAFLAVVSHEIRTPMTGILGMVRLLLESNLNKTQLEYAQTIQDSGDAMLALLNDILDFEKIESGKLDLELIDFDLNRLIQGISRLMSGHAETKGIYLKIEMDPQVPQYMVGDPVRLRQVLLNLIGNSIKFTQKGGVTLSVSPSPALKGRARNNYQSLRFSVKDTGVGISRQAQEKLFTPFSQADSSVNRKFGGTGLGLAISQRLIETMGGKIKIDSVEGEGSTFYFSILLEEGDETAAEERRGVDKTDKSQSQPQRILLVEDNEINRKLLKEFLTRMGHKVALAESGEQALDIIEARTFDLAFMDVQLPGISGMGVTKAIRAMPNRIKATLPVIALTGNVQSEDIRQCYAANMNGHIAKPVDPERLKEMIEKVLAGKPDNPVIVDGEEIDLTTIDRTTGQDTGAAEALSDKSTPGEPGEGLEAAPEPAPAETTPLPTPFPSPLQVPSESSASADESALALEQEDEPDTPEDKDSQEEKEKQDELTPPQATTAPEKILPSQSDLDTAHVAPIHEMAKNLARFELDEEEMEEDSFATAIEKAQEPSDKEDITDSLPFESTMLEGLKSSMAASEFQQMVKSVFDQTDQILHKLADATEKNDLAEIMARMHELKGMTGNFGLQELAHLAERGERWARNGESQDYKELVRKISAAAIRGKEALFNWAGSEA